MQHTFKTMTDALGAGYTLPSSNDKDISGPNSFGYDFEDTDGRQTVTVNLTEERNKIGGTGDCCAMFPPSQD